MITAYIIHERAYNENKKYIVFFSEDGVNSVSISSKKNVHYFNQYQMLEGKKILSLQHPIEHHPPLMGKKLYCGLYLNELIYRFCKPSDPHPGLYSQYRISISLLRESSNIGLVLRHFELKLLQACGYEIDIAHIDAPFVAFCKQRGFIGQYEATLQNIHQKHLKTMIQELQPSEEVKYFFRHILHSLLSASIQSRLLYDKIT